MDLEGLLQSAPLVLMEGAVVERLRRDRDVKLDPYVLHAGLIYETRARAKLEHIYTSYLGIARDTGFRMVLLSPTWRASLDRVIASGLGPVGDFNQDGVGFLKILQHRHDPHHEHMLIGGIMGPRGDAYDPRDALSSKEAEDYHLPQARGLARAGPDCLMAATLPARSEALGMARAMATCEMPYIISVVVRATGALLDGTPFDEFVQEIDASVKPRPMAYMMNCVHPRTFGEAMAIVTARDPSVAERVLGLQANASARDPADLDGLDHLEADSPEDLAEAMHDVRRRFGLKMLGGCCGTDERHIRAIATSFFDTP